MPIERRETTGFMSTAFAKTTAVSTTAHQQVDVDKPVVLSLQATNLKLPGVLLECTLSNPLTSEPLEMLRRAVLIQIRTLPGTQAPL